MKKKAHLWRKTDLFFPVAVLLLASALFFLPFLQRQEGTLAIVRYEAGTQEIPLDKNASYTFESNGHTLCLTVEDGAIFVSESTCHDGRCRKMGRISAKGESILCAKASLSVKIENGKGGLDGVAG